MPLKKEPPCLAYAICMTARSGTDWLCEMICNNGGAGKPREYLNSNNYPEASAQQWRDFTLKVFEQRRHDGRFAVKGAWPELSALMKYDVIDRHIYMRRRDLLFQAISHYRAMAKNHWQRIGDQPAVEPPPFDQKKILWSAKMIVQQNANWCDYFRSAGKRPLCIDYEDLYADPTAVLGQVYDFLRCPRPELFNTRSGHKKMRDETSQQWAERLADVFTKCFPGNPHYQLIEQET